MQRLHRLYSYLYTPVTGFIFFWVLVFLFSAGSSSSHYSSTRELFETYTIRTIFQCITASLCVFVFVPVFLNKNKKGVFVIAMILLLALMYIFCNLIRIHYLEPTYPSTYVNYLKRFSDTSLWGRVSHFPEFINVSLFLLTPTFLLLALKFYRNQQQLLKRNEQKKTAELSALKNQLNPHFLFNTLNNLYALALKKSDQTASVIAKLSDILDYMLYRCDDTFVALEKEVELIENYLTLEEVRYSDRVHIVFDKQIVNPVKIAPLLLLTFIENAFKHGVVQEINTAKIWIKIIQNENCVVFQIKNTIPNQVQTVTTNTHGIGLQNVKQQLNLLYPDAHELDIQEDEHFYTVDLRIQTI
ncbi:sensor histidine kinase [Aquimarina pacifica]|uniref:sensor histidine kinase n=1 Tax=Aquimarina pacifica TaxID=1296415 RepID=UPI00046EB374|nr:histidine kinase [Aquimarina pacifica]